MAHKERFTFIFANCAGGARGETCNPKKLGEVIRAYVDSEGLGPVVAIGLSEVIVSAADNVGRSIPTSALSTVRMNPCLPLSPLLPFDDLSAFQEGYKPGNAERYYLAHVNSRDHCHLEAIRNKWSKIPRLAREHGAGRDVYQGTAALVLRPFQCEAAEGIPLRPAGDDPLSAIADDPLAYRGNRDTEPRAALILRKIRLTDDLSVDLCFCQIETHTADPRIGTWEALERSPGTEHRLTQLRMLNEHLSLQSEHPTVVLGDFNARPGAKELEQFCSHGFRYVLPKVPPRRARTLKVFNSADICAPWPERSERDQWPYTHLKHGIFIDHAFLRALDDNRWDGELRLLNLPGEERDGDRVSDHRPIALTICRRDAVDSKEPVLNQENLT